MPAIAIEIQGDRELAARLAAIRAAGRVGDATLVWAQAVAIKARNAARAKGGRSFWADQARRIRAQRHGLDGAAVLAGPEGLIHDTGGTIRPKNAKALTIPIAEEAKGKRAREFDLGGRDLFVLKSKSGDPDSIGTLGYSEEDGTFHGLFLLRAKSVIPRDPWFPTDDDIRSIGRVELAGFLRRMAEARP